MNQKQIGVIILIIGILFASTIYFVKAKEDTIIKSIIKEKGSCFLEDGTCLHEDRGAFLYVIGWILSSAIIVLGIYLIVFDKTQIKLAENQEKLAVALKDAKLSEKEKDEFSAFLAGFNSEEQAILKAIHDQDGIKQATLRYRTGMSKSTLSLLLKSLEEREFISRKVSGKTNEVFLRKKF